MSDSNLNKGEDAIAPPAYDQGLELQPSQPYYNTPPTDLNNLYPHQCQPPAGIQGQYPPQGQYSQGQYPPQQQYQQPAHGQYPPQQQQQQYSPQGQYPQQQQPTPQVQPYYESSPQVPIVITTPNHHSEGQSSWGPGFPLDMRPAHNIVDPAQYPKSTALYQGLVERFGAQNIVPLPEFLAHAPDKSRTRWYKCDANAQLYFMYRSDKYKANVQKIMNQCCWSNGCCYNPLLTGMHRYTEPVFCQTCCAESLLMFFPQTFLAWPAIYMTSAAHAQRMNPPSTEIEPGMCCICVRATDYRHQFLSRLRKSGIDVSVAPKCFLCLQISFCKQCVAMQQEAVISYVFAKRYGIQFGYGNPKIRKSIYDESKGGSDLWTPYYSALKDNNLFNIRAKTIMQQQGRNNMAAALVMGDSDGLDLPQQEQMQVRQLGSRMSREATIMAHRPLSKLFLEWYKPNKAIEEHNKRWKGTHHLQFASPVVMQ